MIIIIKKSIVAKISHFKNVQYYLIGIGDHDSQAYNPGSIPPLSDSNGSLCPDKDWNNQIRRLPWQGILKIIIILNQLVSLNLTISMFSYTKCFVSDDIIILIPQNIKHVQKVIDFSVHANNRQGTLIRIMHITLKSSKYIKYLKKMVMSVLRIHIHMYKMEKLMCFVT